jgi:predicted dienelactone hydrolase
MTGVRKPRSAVVEMVRRASVVVLAVLAWTSDAAAAGSQPRFDVGYRVLDFPCRENGRDETLTVAVWYPTAAEARPYSYGGPTRGRVAVDAAPLAEGGPYPLLVFSHGYGGGGIGSVFFTEALAARGWIVACPDHHDPQSAVRIRTGQAKRFDRFGMLRDAKAIGASGPGDRDRYSYRLDEMRLVLDRMLTSDAFGRLIDRARIAVGGHSLGGFTALGLCGTIPARRDARIKAVLLFSTGAAGYLFTDAELAAVRMPSMLFFGERERVEGRKRGAHTMAELSAKIYADLPPPKYFLEVKGGSHFSFNNCFANTLGCRLLSGTQAQFDVIRRYAIAFLETYVAERGDPGHVLERGDPMLTRFFGEPAPRAPGD